MLSDQKFMSLKCDIAAENTATLVWPNTSIQTTKIFTSQYFELLKPHLQY